MGAGGEGPSTGSAAAGQTRASSVRRVRRPRLDWVSSVERNERTTICGSPSSPVAAFGVFVPKGAQPAGLTALAQCMDMHAGVGAGIHHAPANIQPRSGCKCGVTGGQRACLISSLTE